MSELAKIHQGRITARADAKSVSSDERHILELQFIADSLEALRVQLAQNQADSVRLKAPPEDR